MLLMDWPNFAGSEVWLSLLTLTFLEIVLGIDNIIFIAIASNKLDKQDRPKATRIGLLLAMVLRVGLLFGISAITAMKKPWFYIGNENSFIHAGFSGQSLILIIGGIFLLYKATTEIHHKLEGGEETVSHKVGGKKATLSSVITQITLINIVFSFDSILTAVGMTTGIQGALIIMILGVVISVLIMMWFANPVSEFVNEHPTIQMLGMAFLILIGFMLIVEGGHMAHFSIADSTIGAIPKGYLYFAIAFSLGVEFLNMRLRKKIQPVQLKGVLQEAKKEHLIDNDPKDQ